MSTWPVACDGQCGRVLEVESATEPAPELTFFCSEECRTWYESGPDEEAARELRRHPVRSDSKVRALGMADLGLSQPDDDAESDQSEHEAGCHCPACVEAVERFWQGEAERAISMETVPDGEAY